MKAQQTPPVSTASRAPYANARDRFADAIRGIISERHRILCRALIRQMLYERISKARLNDDE